MLSLGWKSLWNRRFTVGLTVLAIAISAALMLGVERLRSQARDGFARSASGIDLIVAARGNPVQILLATVFGIGSTGNAIGWDSYESVAAHPAVDWAVPVSMGDNHRGFPVIGTTTAYFDHFRHSGGQPLAFTAGHRFDTPDGAVIGAEVADRFGYSVGTVIINAHGSGAVSFDLHDDAPFTIQGILARTGTAVDRMVLVSLEGFDDLHAGRRLARRDPVLNPAPPSGDDHAEHDHAEGGHDHDHDDAASAEPSHDTTADGHDEHEHHHDPDSINAVLLGLKDRTAVLGLQNLISNQPGEPLTAVLPNVALLELWAITGAAENALRLMAAAVTVAVILGMVAMLLSSLEARRREFAILRSVGATPARIFGLIVLETGLVTLAGLVLGLALLAAAILVADPILAERFGLRLGLSLPSPEEWALIGGFVAFGLLASLVPAYRVYRMTLSDGMAVRA